MSISNNGGLCTGHSGSSDPPDRLYPTEREEQEYRKRKEQLGLRDSTTPHGLPESKPSGKNVRRANYRAQSSLHRILLEDIRLRLVKLRSDISELEAAEQAIFRGT